MLKKRVYFLGIGGISMSGLAEILHNNGYIVFGSDNQPSAITQHLENIGIKVFIGNKKEHITPDIETVVYTAAVRPDNPELQEANRLSIPTIDRAELMGFIMKSYNCPISVAGTHGKTTATSMVSNIFLHANTDPTISIGGILESIGGNFRMGSSDYFIAETCEYYDSFLKFFPRIAVILNIELDHVDYFKNLEQLTDSFVKFAKSIPEDGYLIIHHNALNIVEDHLCTHKIQRPQCNIISYGNIDSDCYADNIYYDESGYPSYDLYLKKQFKGRVTLRVFGEHNILNSLAAFCVAYMSGIESSVIISGLRNCVVANRRFQVKGSFNNITVVDDYAHHPTEIQATLKAAKQFTKGKIWSVFQPHTYTRTKQFLDEFATSFEDSDYIIILDIYAAREKDTGSIHSNDLVEKIKSSGKEVFYFDEFKKAELFLHQRCVPNDLLLTMGAGDVYLIGEHLISN